MLTTILAMLLAGQIGMMDNGADESDWMIVSQSKQRVHMLNTKSIRVVDSGAGRAAWVKTNYSTPENGISSLLVRWQWDCGTETATQLTAIAYDANGRVIRRSGAKSLPLPIAPDTIGYVTMNTVCGIG